MSATEADLHAHYARIVARMEQINAELLDLKARSSKEGRSAAVEGAWLLAEIVVGVITIAAAPVTAGWSLVATALDTAALFRSGLKMLDQLGDCGQLNYDIRVRDDEMKILLEDLRMINAAALARGIAL
ncbi:hypothetical protein [Ferrovibrio sp.]|uniref:hypothetical protein n=1 Tax=Ferrovibrio sp. TaxID=1917215 RepID=UPI00391A86AC